jgi:hypothetical protein
VTAVPNAARAACFLADIAYYSDHEALLRKVLDDLITSARPEPGDTPASLFAALRSGLGSDPGRTATIAALALMRLAEELGDVPPNAGSAS